jgi:uroporphyrinogen-III synthase
MKPLVIVRPEPGASATAEAARKLGLDPVVMPLFSIEPVGWEAPSSEKFNALLFTSANALRHGGSGLEAIRYLPAHCVGEATAAAAREGGFNVASVGTGGVDALLQQLPAGLKLLHLCGADWREPASATQSIEHVPVYRAAEVDAPDIHRIEGAIVAVYSPRAARVLGRHVDRAGLTRGQIAIAAISRAAAEAVRSGWQALEIAAEPTDSALLAIAARLCDKSG